ncbi:MAG: hypothetical protein QOD12_639, partial [Verrucomicrobiota bacterium]
AAIAFANGARGCFTKPDQAATLTAAIADLNETHHLAAA